MGADKGAPPMNVLVVGSGGREHALCWAIARSPRCGRLYAAPGNAGIADVAECVEIASDDIEALVAFATEQAIDFVVVGPEGPLVAGLVDRLAQRNIAAFGPSASAAAIEGSKAFMKDLCARHRIPTAGYASFNEPDAAKEYIHTHGAPLVVKADGLAAGKGVILCHTEIEAFAAIDHLMTERAFGEAGDEVVIEDMLQGEEASFFALVDGETVVPLGSAQDHKAAFDGDAGPNTGGMGAYTPAPVITEDMARHVMDTIIRPTVRAMADEGCPFKGVLYAGLMITRDGPQLLEFNARFGDPECQAMLLRLKTDLLDVLYACAQGRLSEIDLRWDERPSLVVVMATRGYPGWYEKGSTIDGLERLKALPGVQVFHAGTRRKSGVLTADGGRVLGIASIGATVAEAQKRAYQAIALIDWPEGFCRTDIGWRAIAR